MTLSLSSSSLHNCSIGGKRPSFTVGLLLLLSLIFLNPSRVASFTSSSSFSSSCYYQLQSIHNRKSNTMWMLPSIITTTRTSTTTAFAVVVRPVSCRTPLGVSSSFTRRSSSSPLLSRYLYTAQTTTRRSPLRRQPQATCLKSTPHDDNTNNNVETTKAAVESLLGNVMGRAARTLSTTSDATTTNPSSDNNEPNSKKDKKEDSRGQPLFSNRDDTTTTTTTEKSTTATTASQPTNQNNQTNKNDSVSNGTPYLENPAITLTALAKEQWSHIIRPHQDTVIDATCGNGNDSLAIAKLLFPSSSSSSDDTTSSQGKLICIDIQQTACDNTKQQLQPYLEMEGGIPMDDSQYVEIRTASHSPLFPTPVDSSDDDHPHKNPPNIGLVCYNLGYLPSNTKGDDHASSTTFTQVSSTISSMADAALHIRVGGMLSVMTYPRTNPNEDYAVHAMLEGLGLLSSKTMDWRHYLQELGPDYQVWSTDTGGTVKAITTTTATTAGQGNASRSSGGGIPDTGSTATATESYSVRDIVQKAVERVVEEGPVKQTWRVMEHKQMGRPLSPIFLTAIRIK